MKRLNGKIDKKTLLEIRECLIRGDSNRLICYNFKISEADLVKVYGNLMQKLFYIRLSKNNKILGYKDDTVSEEELMEFPNYSWKTLSQNEKIFYKQHGKRRSTSRNPGHISRHYSTNTSLE